MLGKTRVLQPSCLYFWENWATKEWSLQWKVGGVGRNEVPKILWYFLGWASPQESRRLTGRGVRTGRKVKKQKRWKRCRNGGENCQTQIYYLHNFAPVRSAHQVVNALIAGRWDHQNAMRVDTFHLRRGKWEIIARHKGYDIIYAYLISYRGIC